MSVWKNCRKRVIADTRNLNRAGMIRAGFQADPGRTLTKEEISQLSLTPPDQIRDCRANPQDIFWR